MFTLRDQVFPSEAGTAQAIPDSVYRYKIGGICDELNAAERARTRELRPLGRRLRRATTTAQQRNALLDAVRHQTARTSHALAALTALDPPKPRAAGHRSTKATWNRNLDRIRTYAEQLDGASDRRQVIAAIGNLSRQRSKIARDSVRVTAGLQRLGQENCRIAPPISTSTLTLPPPRGEASGGASTQAQTAASSAGRGGSGASEGTRASRLASGGRGATGGPSIETPRSTGGPSIETPSSDRPSATAPAGGDGGESTGGTGGGDSSTGSTGGGDGAGSTGGAAE